jgi:aminoglycoside phosphotransferase family enzyme
MADDTVPLSEKVAALRDTASYADRPLRVEAIETHRSWVFLTDTLAYKLKKPAHRDQLDFGTLSVRRHFCEEELRLNRRLAERTYLDVVPLVLTPEQTLVVEGQGTPVEWLVKMRRLPAQRMLAYALAEHQAGPGDAQRVAARVAAFHQRLPSAQWTPRAYRHHLRATIVRNEQVLTETAFGLNAASIRLVCRTQAALLERAAGVFDQRVHRRRIVEGHADLRPEHVCLVPPVQIIDCLEFSATLRTLDTIDEAAFLALECERAGRADFANEFLHAYAAAAHERLPEPLVDFYRSYRATIRARLAIEHLREAAYRVTPHWAWSAQRYLRFAQHYAQQCEAAWDDGTLKFQSVR